MSIIKQLINISGVLLRQIKSSSTAIFQTVMKMLATASETFYFKVCDKQDQKSLDGEEGKIHKNYLTDLLD